MGLAGLILRPLLAVWFYLSGHLIEKVGDLKCPYLYIVSPFSHIVHQHSLPCSGRRYSPSGGLCLSYAGLNIYFSKRGSKASSAAILGKKSGFVFLIKNSFIRYFIGKLRHVFPFCVLNLVEIFIDYLGNLENIVANQSFTNLNLIAIFKLFINLPNYH